VFTVALIGPDGAGKTTISRELEAELGLPVKSIYMGVNLYSSSTMLPHMRLILALRRRLHQGDPSVTSDIKSITARPTTMIGRLAAAGRSGARLANWLAEEWYRQAVAAYHTRRGTVVVFDRHFLADFYEADGRTGAEERRMSERVHLFLLLHIYPKPDLIICLDAPAEVLHARKPEGSIERLRRKQADYRALLKLLPNVMVLDATKPTDEVVQEVARAIRSHHESQARKTSPFSRQRTAAEEDQAPGKRAAPNRGKTETRRPTAIVIGLDCITGLQTARILARHQVPVVGVASDMGHFCCRTRVCERIVKADTSSDDELIAALQTLGSTFDQMAVLVPCTDLSVLTISRRRSELEDNFFVALPDNVVVELLTDKASFYAYAQDQGLPIPQTALLTSPEDAKEAAASLRFPCVLKPPLKTPLWEQHARDKAYMARTPKELIAIYEEVGALATPLLAQEWISGSEGEHFTCNCYFDRESKPLVTFVTRKIRQWPPQTGAGSLAVEWPNEVVVDETVRLFSKVGFWGLAYLEMKRDANTGEHLIIEPNVGRPTGRSATAEAAGVELLYAMYCDVVGLPLPEANLAQRFVGAKWIYFGRDIRSAFHYWRRDELSIGEWLHSLRGPKVDAVFSWRDPLPFWFDVWRALGLARRSVAGAFRD
jgi:D-aspartate ligase